MNDGNEKNPMEVTVRNVYGRELIYPACDRTEAIAKIAGIKTLQPKHLEIMRDAFGIDTITITESSWEGLNDDK